MKVSMFTPKNLAEGVSVDEILVKDSKPENVSTALLSEESEESMEMEMEDR